MKKLGNYLAVKTRIWFILLLLMVWSCNKPQVIENPLWSSTNPFTIPTKTRVQKYLKGNLITNYSFEDGKTFPIDTTTRYWLIGWKKIGNNIAWVNTKIDSIYTPDDVSSGTHAIKINRTQANETVTIGDGIESDFIKVIPGNYELTFDIKLKNIKPYQARLGTNLKDAIDIRIQFFDKTKTPIPGTLYSYILNKEIDYSFKAYQFANYPSIDSMGWGRVRGKSFDPPILDGIIPNNAQYVKLFFGLKGTGTMWVDNVDFRYAENNLSLLERIDIIVDSVQSPYEILVPQPKCVVPKDTFKLVNNNASEAKWVIVKPEQTNTEFAIGLQSLINKLSNIQSDTLSVTIETVTHLSDVLREQANVIISVGNTSLHNRYIELFPYADIKNKPEGYFIYSTKELPKIFFLGGNTTRAVNYAISTFNQLINDTAACIYNAGIVDYPSFETRGVIVNYVDNDRFKKLDSNFHKLYTEKFNQILFDNESSILTGKQDLVEIQKQYFKSNISSCFNNVVLVNPFLTDYKSKKDLCYNLSLTPTSFNSYLRYLNNKVDALYISFGKENEEVLKNCLQTSIDNWDIIETIHNHTNYINQSEIVTSQFPKLQVKFIPTGTDLKNYFSSKSNIKLYYSYVFPLLSKQNQFVLSGKNAYSPVIDYIDYYRFSPYFNQFPEILYSDIQTEALINESYSENHLFVGNKRLYSLIGPCELDFLTLNNEFSGQNKINFNLNVLSPIDILRLSTYADYSWNPEAYKPTISIWKVLLSSFGKETAYQILEFNDLFVKLLELLNTPLNANNFNRIEKNGIQLIQDIENKYNLIKSSGKLTEELLQHLRINYYDVAHTFNTKINIVEKQLFTELDTSLSGTRN